PFKLDFVEVGNEDNFDGSKSYEACRFKTFYKAIKARYPSINVIASEKQVFDVKPDVVDEHFYDDAPTLHLGFDKSWHENVVTMLDEAHRYDSYSRSGPKIFVGEYAAKDWGRELSPSNLGSAIGEAVAMTGMERNSDIVMGAAYAPLFAHGDVKPIWTP